MFDETKTIEDSRCDSYASRWYSSFVAQTEMTLDNPVLCAGFVVDTCQSTFIQNDVANYRSGYGVNPLNRTLKSCYVAINPPLGLAAKRVINPEKHPPPMPIAKHYGVDLVYFANLAT